MSNFERILFTQLNEVVLNENREQGLKHLIMMGITFPDEWDHETTCEEVYKVMHGRRDAENEDERGWGLVTEDNKIVSIKRIDGNVLGDEGRWDWLVSFEKPVRVNVIARLSTPVKWVEDFIDNYAADYGCTCDEY